jgi:hypothetical protein
MAGELVDVAILRVLHKDLVKKPSRRLTGVVMTDIDMMNFTEIWSFYCKIIFPIKE